MSSPAEPTPAERLQRCLEQVVRPREGLLLALSGGSDSVALLGAAVEGDRPVLAAHVQHGLRAAAEQDARAAAALCAGLGLDCEILRAPPRLPNQRSETAARERRLGALAQLARERGLDWILTGHHLDDALETALLNLRRGHRGARALAGIPTLRPASTPGHGDGPRFLRPFLWGAAPPGRSELLAWREARGLPCRHDESNDDVSIPRNALRVVLAENRPPLTRQRLSALRRRARGDLLRAVGRAAAELERHLRPEGFGARLERQALDPTGSWGALVECLRLLGPCLAPAHRLTLRGTVLARVAEGLRRGHGRLLLPAAPRPLAVECRPDGLHLPEVVPAPGDPAARVLAGLWSTPLFL